jgi:small subunit ribosomal protein S5
MAKINPDTLNLVEQVIKTNKVQKTHKGGRTMRWSVLSAVGDHEGHIGIGLGKAAGIPDAIRKSIEDAKKNIVKIPLIDGTVPHEVVCRLGAARVMIKPASPGTGVVAGGAVRPIVELAGIKDVLAKVLGSRNAINTARATIMALTSMKIAENVCRARNKKMEDLVPWMAKKIKAQEKAAPEMGSTNQGDDVVTEVAGGSTDD